MLDRVYLCAVTNSAPAIELQHEPRLCYAMQQSAVPWLRAVAIRNDGAEVLRDLVVRVELVAFADPVEAFVDELAAGARLAIEVPDVVLRGAAFAALDERVRTELVVDVRRRADDEPLARTARPIDVLAYNEWPGLDVLPPLLATFVQPNHPSLLPLLHLVGERLHERTGNGGLDGYQSGDPKRASALLASVHDAVVALRVRYVSAPASFEQNGQKVRMPEQVVHDRLGTCLDLTLLYAALLEHCGLDPFVVMMRGHAFVGVWLREASSAEQQFGSAVELRKGCAAGTMAVCETTVACVQPAQPFARAEGAALKRLWSDEQFAVAIDIDAARRAGYRPLPTRRRAADVDPDEAVDVVASKAGGDAGPDLGAPDLGAAALEAEVLEAPASEPEVVVDEAIPPLPPLHQAPRDRLEHWRQQLLDLTMFNRLLNFVETKKTVRLCGHDLGAIEDRLQSAARVRIHARPQLGDPGSDPRDLELRAERSGEDLLRAYLADELDHGRLRAEYDQEQLDVRLTEIFRHARTSIEESGANTLYLALGFLRWYESPQSSKPRLAPLLLLPIVIERLSVQEGYRFVMDDAEVRVNTTLLQLLDRDFDLRVALGEQLPEDERGIDVDAVLDAFRQAALGMPRWEVEAVASVGFFSFTKYLMWRDLDDREGLLQSPVLRHLIDAPGSSLPQDVPEVARDSLDDFDPADVFCPKDADSSQLAAVMAGSAGRSFVLEGPPGTGKSQTITNLIAQSLASGKRVLFVAEKRAALEVVHGRLSDVGLAPFCLELHSQKSGPKAVLEQLRTTLELGQRRPPAEWQQVADDLQEQREQLNAFVLALHRRREHGWSVFQSMTRLIELRTAQRLPVDELLDGTPEHMQQAHEALDAFLVAAGPLGVPARAAWWGVRRGDWTPAVTRDVAPMLDRLHAAAAGLRDALAPVLAALGLDAEQGPSRVQLQELLQLLRVLQSPSPPPPEWLTLPNWRLFEQDLERACAIGTRRDELWQQLAPRWRRDLLELDLGALAARYRLYAESFFVMRWWRLRSQKAVLAGVSLGSLGAATAIRDDLDIALRVRDEARELEACTVARETLAGAWRNGQLDWPQHAGWLERVREIRQLVLRLVPGSLEPAPQVLAAIAARLGALAEGAGGEWSRSCGDLQAAHDGFAAALAALREFLELDDDAAFGEADEPGFVENVLARVDACRANPAGLRDMCAWRRAAVLAERAHLDALVAAHATGELPLADVRPAFERSVHEGWLDRVHEREPALARFRGRDHEAAILEFAKLDRDAIRLGAEVVVARLAARLPQLRDTQVASSELGVLERELKKQRRHKPVRRLLHEIRGLWPRLSPCVLMSPLSVAQFLGQHAQRFDVVVFDEASQIPMWDAVGAIGRGDSLIVVGDSRQLPPTNFFRRVTDEGADESGEIPEDLESVLDECGAAGLPRMHLDWHYRSRHESLIAFSNHHYYQNRLLTFPSPQAAGDGFGVRSVRVDGIYDRAGSQTNRIEAEALVQEVVRRLRDPQLARRSIGIVTFSRAQQTLIEDLLDAERRADPSLEAALAANDEELFVKNLENVQGDERDVILFSICYGRDAAGKVYENYGPLNLQGGERRLNVAVTRARYELVVFSSIGPEHVANRSAALGARHLRNFLEYAARGEAALRAATELDPSRGVESPFEQAVRDALVEKGYELHSQVGCSGYRIDLGVVDPATPGRYLLGIECDGATYHRAATARDRDRLRAAVLAGLGWRLVRVWSTDFWQDAAGEIDRLVAEIEAAREAWAAHDMAQQQAIEAATQKVVETAPRVEGNAAAMLDEASGDGTAMGADAQQELAVGTPSSEVTPAGSRPTEPQPAEPGPPDPDGPRPYESCAATDGEDRVVAERLLATEAPIVFSRYVRALASVWGVSRVTDRVRERASAALPEGAIDDAGVLWRTDEQRRAFRGFREPWDGQGERDADELPVVEVDNALRWLLRQHHTIGEEDLMREAARGFGIQRLGSVVREVMAGGVQRLVDAGGGVREDDKVRLSGDSGS